MNINSESSSNDISSKQADCILTRNSRKKLDLLESVCKDVSILTGIPVTLFDRNGNIIFRSISPLNAHAKNAILNLRKWFFKQLRSRNPSFIKPQAPGPVIFSTGNDRFWSAISMKPTVWSQDLLLIGPARPDHAEGALQLLSDIVCLNLHNEKAKSIDWIDSSRKQVETMVHKDLRNSKLIGKKAFSLPAEDCQEQCILAIKTGDQDKLKASLTLLNNQYENISNKQLRSSKNNSLLLAQRAVSGAIEAALDSDSANGILSDWLYNIENCQTAIEVFNWISSLFSELCLQVKEQLQAAWTQPVRLCQHYIQRRVYSKITLEDLSRYTGHNPGYLSRHFKEKTGESISYYIQKVKIETACKLLRFYNKPIADVAIMLAFSDQAHFTRAFRQITGTTPLKFCKTPENDN